MLLAHGWGANYSTVLPLGEQLADLGHEILLFTFGGMAGTDLNHMRQ